LREREAEREKARAGAGDPTPPRPGFAHAFALEAPLGFHGRDCFALQARVQRAAKHAPRVHVPPRRGVAANVPVRARGGGRSHHLDRRRRERSARAPTRIGGKVYRVI